MTAPFTIVTFTDTEGDEFSIRVGATIEDQGRERIERTACSILDDFIESGEMLPSCPVKVTGVEVR